MALHRNILLPEQALLFDALCSSPELQGLTLVGGTALALQIGHRVSLDFDFASFEDRLPGFAIDQLISRLKGEGHQVTMVTSPSEISAFKIRHGISLLDYARDYVVDGVKVTFFAHGKNDAQRNYYQQASCVDVPGGALKIMSVDGLKTAKTLVLEDRVRSRDLYDLYVLMRDHGYAFDQLFSVIKKLGLNNDSEYFKAVLSGAIPVDSNDEGLEAVNLGEGLEASYEFFKSGLEVYERKLARERFEVKSPGM